MKCLICKTELEKESVYGDITSYHCPYCGTYYEVLKDERIDIDEEYEDECPCCGSKLIWNSDFMLSDFNPNITEDKDDSIVSFYSCSKCGCEIQMIMPTENEIEKYDYYKEKP